MMKRKSWKLVVLAVLVISGLPIRACAQDTGSSSQQGPAGSKPLEQQISFHTVLKERRDTIQTLIAIVQKPGVDDSYGGPKYSAIKLLGDLRAVEAISILAENLMYMPSGVRVISEIRPREAFYESAIALRDIGEPAIPAMVRIIEDSKNQEETNEATWVIMEIEGKEQAAYRFERLSKKDKTETGGRYYTRYDNARSFILNYKPVLVLPTPVQPVPNTQN